MVPGVAGLGIERNHVGAEESEGLVTAIQNHTIMAITVHQPTTRDQAGHSLPVAASGGYWPPDQSSDDE